MTKTLINKGYITYANVNDIDYNNNQITINFYNIETLEDIIQLIINNGFNPYHHKVDSIKVNNKYYLRGYDKVVNIINQMLNTKLATKIEKIKL